jgi:hypothetical protein
MTTELRLARTELYSTGTVYKRGQLRTRNLGSAIFLVAIEDYRSLREEQHKSAEQFLYPQTPEWQEHFDWAVALAEGLNPAWLRDTLDRFKEKWDGQRSARIRPTRPSSRNRAPKRKEPAYEVRRCS